MKATDRNHAERESSLADLDASSSLAKSDRVGGGADIHHGRQLKELPEAEAVLLHAFLLVASMNYTDVTISIVARMFGAVKLRGHKSTSCDLVASRHRLNALRILAAMDGEGTRNPGWWAEYGPEAVLARRVADLRRKQGWSQQELADRLREYGFDHHQTAISRIEAGRQSLSLNEAAALAAIFRIRPADLMDISMNEESLTAELHEMTRHYDRLRHYMLDARARVVETTQARDAAREEMDRWLEQVSVAQEMTAQCEAELSEAMSAAGRLEGELARVRDRLDQVASRLEKVRAHRAAVSDAAPELESPTDRANIEAHMRATSKPGSPRAAAMPRLAKGDRVLHRTLGTGTVVAASNAEATIKFDGGLTPDNTAVVNLHNGRSAKLKKI